MIHFCAKSRKKWRSFDNFFSYFGFSNPAPPPVSLLGPSKKLPGKMLCGFVSFFFFVLAPPGAHHLFIFCGLGWLWVVVTFRRFQYYSVLFNNYCTHCMTSHLTSVFRKHLTWNKGESLVNILESRTYPGKIRTVWNCKNRWLFPVVNCIV